MAWKFPFVALLVLGLLGVGALFLWPGPPSVPEAGPGEPPESSASQARSSEGPDASGTRGSGPVSGSGPVRSKDHNAVTTETDAVPSGSSGLDPASSLPTSENEAPGPGPSAQAFDEVRRHARTDDEGLVEVHHPDGTVTVDLQGRFRSVPVATRDEDGRIQIRE